MMIPLNQYNLSNKKILSYQLLFPLNIIVFMISPPPPPPPLSPLPPSHTHTLSLTHAHTHTYTHAHKGHQGHGRCRCEVLRGCYDRRHWLGVLVDTKRDLFSRKETYFQEKRPAERYARHLFTRHGEILQRCYDWRHRLDVLVDSTSGIHGCFYWSHFV